MTDTAAIVVDPLTLKRQSEASDPLRSAWVSANAGSGKTYVLTRRVVRLLLNGSDPSRILCLTFTNAAAGEMSNRVFETLSDWAVMPESELADTLQKLTGTKPGAGDMREARRLFARALETPGGLKIQTIHAFCESLLHQFPLEANIAGHFDVLDAKAQEDLIKEAQRQVILAAQAENPAELGTAFATVLAAASDQKIEQAFKAVIDNRHQIKIWITQEGGLDQAMAALLRRWNFGPDETPASLISRSCKSLAMNASQAHEIADAAERTTAATNKKLAATLRAAVAASSPGERYSILEKAFLTASGSLRKTASVYTSKLAKEIPDMINLVDREFARFEQIRDSLNLLKQLEDSRALFVLGEAVIDAFEAMKTARGLLDFDDLIVHTANLLGRSNARHWVQYKLDQGIDHVLVDEAQDTNPHQWQVITSLVEEFFSGQGARDIERTVFAVGDEKQSIYSFQGAEPDAFASQRDRLKIKAEKAEKPFSTIRLILSFRSTPDVLSAVDTVFSTPENYNGLSRDRQATIHDTIRQQDPGLVEIWPLIAKQKVEEPDDWAKPVDQLSTNDPQVQLARKIAERVAGWLKQKTWLEGRGRPIRAGDILVLVRSRDRFATALTRELKLRKVSVAGSDRLHLTDHIAVQDLLAIGRVVLLPEDDLSLAAVLKSPLYGFDEELLYQLASDREKQSLFEALFTLAKTSQKARFALEHIQTLRRRVDQMPVYEFYALLLGADGGRAKIIARLGQGVEEVLDAFLAQIHKHELSGLPGLENFIEWLVTSAPEIKREFDMDMDEVRIMTVHAAKGLEAPIVFLVDKGAAPYNGRFDPELINLDPQNETGNGGFLWLADKKKAAQAICEALADVKVRAEEEYQRLLYVAMTRAADRLVVCGTRGLKEAHEDCWHNVVMRALGANCEPHLDTNGNTDFYRWQKSTPARPDNAGKPEQEAKREPEPLPAWINRQLPKEPKLPRPLTPSGAQALIDDKGWQAESPLGHKEDKPSAALLRGVAIHRLLQTLPEMTRDNAMDMDDLSGAGKRYLAATNPAWTSAEMDSILKQVFLIINNPAFSHLFSRTASRAEVALSGMVELSGGPRLVSGQIDRLVVEENCVTIIDYKTNRHVPQAAGDIQPGYVTQLALYRRIVQKIYPLHEIRAGILWTEIPRLQFIPETQLDAAFWQIAQA